MNCEENGVTRLMLTSIPFFREVIIMSFACEQCGFHNSEVQFGGSIQEQGVRYEVEIRTPQVCGRIVCETRSAALSCSIQHPSVILI